MWDVLGGHVDGDESPQEALVRELDEELGIAVDTHLGEPLTRIVDPDSQDGGLDITIWVVRTWLGDIANQAADEHDALGWFGADDVQALPLAHPALRPLLNELLSRE